MEIIKCQQGSDEWFEHKLGMVSTSNFAKVLNKGEGRKLYMRKLAAERLSGVTQVSYTDNNMEAGQELESLAREYYEAVNKCEVEQVGFVKMNDWVGCSPDGLVGDDGLIEIKSPIPSTHINNILKGKMPTTYIPQVQGQMLVTGRSWCDWISFCPALTTRPFYSIRVYRDEEYFDKLIEAIDKFVGEFKEMLNKITETEF